MDQASAAFSGASFHCYAGSVGNQDTFHKSEFTLYQICSSARAYHSDLQCIPCQGSLLYRVRGYNWFGLVERHQVEHGYSVSLWDKPSHSAMTQH